MASRQVVAAQGSTRRQDLCRRLQRSDPDDGHEFEAYQGKIGRVVYVVQWYDRIDRLRWKTSTPILRVCVTPIISGARVSHVKPVFCLCISQLSSLDTVEFWSHHEKVGGSSWLLEGALTHTVRAGRRGRQSPRLHWRIRLVFRTLG